MTSSHPFTHSGSPFRKSRILLFFTLLVGAIILVSFLWPLLKPVRFDGKQAYQHVLAQVQMGPRIPGSPAHHAAVKYITSQLQRHHWEVLLQETTISGIPVINIIAHRGSLSPRLILGAHYDTRQLADQDENPDQRNQPVPGANDGASGVAVLLEIARVLPKETKDINLVFFDVEDQGEINGLPWIIGSSYYAQQLTVLPEAVIIIDMIGDADQQIYFERNSDTKLQEEIWQIAADLGFSSRFLPYPRFSMLDDHTPFLQRGIAAVDIIDFDYPYWHKTSDTPDKVSPESLAAVGRVLVQWIHQRGW
ncbi:predicted aminopeptidases [Anaerolinea thermolimosa]|uniref:M28 family peptidase n=1 Tax=Anaerolinea thermolimosa TaxID=229919 RepID=UPI0007846F9C|nr:M28 family peptidase [Anaerolinea thermolimosa]GAP06619.1 predicted aminopeptidases [Anaerolinea thermolimosa]